MAKMCFLCDSEDSLIDFNDQTFKNCSLKLAFRKEKNFKYNDVELAKTSLDFVGYHSKCYKKVTVLGNKYNEEFTIFCGEDIEKRNNSLKTGNKCKYDAADEFVYKIMEKDPVSPTPNEADLLESSGTSEYQVMPPIQIERPRSIPAVSPNNNESNSSQPRKRLLDSNEFSGLRKRKMQIELELAKVKLDIAKRESYKLDLELLKLERELNVTRHSVFTLPIVMQSDVKYVNVLHDN